MATTFRNLGPREKIDPNTVRTTELYYATTGWTQEEIHLLSDKFETYVSRDPRFPNYLIMYGGYSKMQVLSAIRSSRDVLTVVQKTGINQLKFIPTYFDFS
jgi:hypothetical protein